MIDWPESANMLPLSVAELWVYPVKSCAGIRLSSVELLDTGLEWDRAWMVVDENGEFVSQRELPRMARVQPRFHLGQLELHAPGMLSLHVRLDAAERPCRVRVWDDEVNAYDMGDLAAQWFSDFLLSEGPPVAGLKHLRLVRFDPEVRRLSSMNWTKGVEATNQFSDGFPVLVLSQASLVGLNERLAVHGHKPVTMARFRPNVVLGGLQEHDEDRLSDLRLHALGASEAPSVWLQLVKPCARCSIPEVEPSTAHRHPAVTEAMRSYRADKRLLGAITFGMNAIVRGGWGQMLHEGMLGEGRWSGWD